jgi:hypothetical protein
MRKIDYITPIKNELDEKMHELCFLFMTIGTPGETPRYYNFRHFDRDTKTLTIGSTQKRSLYFTIDLSTTNINFIFSNDFWQQFKEYRTKFLLENYKTINPY